MAFTPHDAHDPLLIAAHAAGDTTGQESRLAADLVATCEACATLHADLVAIAATTRVLPAPVRTHDYRLTPEQAAKLRPTVRRRLLAALGSPRFAFAAPLGATLATLGLAGLLLAAIPGVSLQAATSSSAANVNIAAAAPSVVTNGAGAAVGPALAAGARPTDAEYARMNARDVRTASRCNEVAAGVSAGSAPPDTKAPTSSEPKYAAAETHETRQRSIPPVPQTAAILGAALIALRLLGRRFG